MNLSIDLVTIEFKLCGHLTDTFTKQGQRSPSTHCKHFQVMYYVYFMCAVCKKVHALETKVIGNN